MSHRNGLLVISFSEMFCHWLVRLGVSASSTSGKTLSLNPKSICETFRSLNIVLFCWWFSITERLIFPVVGSNYSKEWWLQCWLPSWRRLPHLSSGDLSQSSHNRSAIARLLDWRTDGGEPLKMSPARLCSEHRSANAPPFEGLWDLPQDLMDCVLTFLMTVLIETHLIPNPHLNLFLSRTTVTHTHTRTSTFPRTAPKQFPCWHSCSLPGVPSFIIHSGKSTRPCQRNSRVLDVF